MRRFILILIYASIVPSILAQDKIVKINREIIEARILEVTESVIRYKDFYNLDGPDRMIFISEVIMIIFEDGKREIFRTEQEKQEESVDQNKRKAFIVGVGGDFQMSIDDEIYIDPSVEVKIQYILPNEKIAFHASIGYIPVKDGGILYSAGVKWYMVNGLYIDLQGGAFGKWEDPNAYDPANKFGFKYGPSLLLGYDLFISDLIGFNVAVGASLDAAPAVMEVTAAGEVGILFRF